MNDREVEESLRRVDAAMAESPEDRVIARLQSQRFNRRRWRSDPHSDFKNGWNQALEFAVDTIRQGGA